MLIFIDESGDTGFKQSSSRFFTLAMVVFSDNKQGVSPLAEETSEQIKLLQQKYHIKPEYKFSKTDKTNRNRFFEGIQKCRFQVFALVIDKERIHSKVLRSKQPEHRTKFYNFLLKELLTHNPIKNANVKIDGDKNRLLRMALETYLRRENPELLTKLTFENSHRNRLIQLADMVCGAIHYKFSKHGAELESDRWVKMLGTKVKNIWPYTGK